MKTLLHTLSPSFLVYEDSLDITNRQDTIRKHFRALKAISIANYNFFSLHSSTRMFLRQKWNEKCYWFPRILFTSQLHFHVNLPRHYFITSCTTSWNDVDSQFPYLPTIFPKLWNFRMGCKNGKINFAITSLVHKSRLNWLWKHDKDQSGRC